MKKSWLMILCAALIALTAVFAAGCKTETVKTVGEGTKTFEFKVTDKDGNVTEFKVRTNEETVGAALLKEKLIEGEDSQYGLYVKKVNGITAEYEVDGTYWAFYINGEYAMTGVDQTNVEEGAVYEFKVEK